MDVSDNEARCDLSNLQASVGSRQEIGSTTYVEVIFTNEGSSCWISGFPQVLFASGGATVSEAARDGEDPGNVYTIPEGGRVGVTLTAESVDGVDGCTAADADQVDIINTNGSGSTSLRLSLRVCQEMASVAVSPYEPRS
ncbi:PF14016 family protein [Actinomyces sp. ICM58]|nr:PF14016 family protein [Actinomyces sp. ICM58]